MQPKQCRYRKSKHDNIRSDIRNTVIAQRRHRVHGTSVVYPRVPECRKRSAVGRSRENSKDASRENQKPGEVENEARYFRRKQPIVEAQDGEFWKRNRQHVNVLVCFDKLEHCAYFDRPYDLGMIARPCDGDFDFEMVNWDQ